MPASILTKKRILFLFFIMCSAISVLIGRIFYIQIFKADYYQALAFEQQTRDRLIAPRRGDILDRNGTPIATTKTAFAVSVVHNQVENPEIVAKHLANLLNMDYNIVLEKVEKRVALNRIKGKVEKEVADKISALNLKGVKIDEDIQRIYPYNDLAAQVIGFVGKDNQGIIGLEAKYDSFLRGEKGKIMTQTDVWGKEIENGDNIYIDPVPGYSLRTSLDANIQLFAQQTIHKAVTYKQAKQGSIIVMNPQNGEIYAMATEPSFDLNRPFEIEGVDTSGFNQKQLSDALNKMWRNPNINDTYEPGSTFKVITSCAGLEEGVVKESDSFNCSGGKEVGGRYIKCWRSPRSHGSETFVEGVANSCNPVFMEVAGRLGSDKFYEYMLKFAFNKKTGIDLPGEAVGIMHKKENMGPVELATMSFGQSFQITPVQLLRAISSAINGGRLITPHLGVSLERDNVVQRLVYNEDRSISEETSRRMLPILENVVYKGSGNKAYIPGFRIGGKTATSQKLPRGSGKYIASFCAFAPAENPQVIALVLIDEPQGVYYGGQVAGPVMKELLENILPYLGIDPKYNEEELEIKGVAPVTVPDFTAMSLSEAKAAAEKLNLVPEIIGQGDKVINQLPTANEIINQKSKIILYTQ